MGLNSSHNSSLFYDNPLFCTLITLSLLVFLYFPNYLIKSIFYPILISTLILLLSILRLGVSQRIKHQNQSLLKNNIFESLSEVEFETLLPESNSKINLKLEPKSIPHTKTNPRPELESITLIKDHIEPEPEPGPKCITLTKDLIKVKLELKPELITFAKDLIQLESESKSITFTKDLIQLEPESKSITFTKDLIEKEPESDSIIPTKDLSELKAEVEPLIKPGPKPKPQPEPESITLNKDLIEPKPEFITVTKESVTKIESSQDKLYVDPHYNACQTELIQPHPTNNKELLYRKENFVEWDVWGPLEVIYEEEEHEEETQYNAFLCNRETIERYPSLSKYYPESDTESDTDTVSSSCSLDEDFERIQQWEEEDDEDKEGMFEIALDYGFHVKNGNLVNKLKKMVEFDEEDNLIEIDISNSKIENDTW